MESILILEHKTKQIQINLILIQLLKYHNKVWTNKMLNNKNKHSKNNI